MKKISTIICCIISILYHPKVSGEDINLKPGEWRSHFAWNNSFAVSVTPKYYITATSQGLVFLSREDYTLKTETGVNKLSDTNINSIEYIEKYNSILIGYSNGNIDIIKDKRVYNINDLKIKNLQGSKAVNHFKLIGETLFCATDFGILTINMNSREIESSFYIGDEASDLIINSITYDGKYIYAATEDGIKRVDSKMQNMQLYSNWEQFSQDNKNYANIIATDNHIIAARGSKNSEANIYAYSKEGTIINSEEVTNYQNIKAEKNKIIVTSSSTITVYNNSLNIEWCTSNYKINNRSFSPSFTDAMLTDNNKMVISDINMGMLLFEKEVDTWHNFLPNGPYNNNSHFITAAPNGDIWVVPGGVNQYWNNENIPASASLLAPGGWKHFTRENSSVMHNGRDILYVTINPENPNNIFLSSYGNGIYEIDKTDDGLKVINNFFTPENGLQNIFENPASRFVRVASSDFDRNNILWMTNAEVDNGLVAYSPKEQLWKRFSYESLIDQHTMNLVTVTSNYNWLTVTRGNSKGLFVWDDNNTPMNQSDDRYRSAIHPRNETDSRNAGQIQMWDQNREVITDNIFAIEEDHNGHLWFGTDKGVVVMYQPQTVFSREYPVFSRILIAREDDTGLADYLLGNEIVNTIAVDPGNRKWLGTEGSGVFLVSPDGSEQLKSFNSSNSPLPSNYINSITVNEITGEVFFATSEGLVSYKDIATKGEETFSQMYVYPNPVRPGFEGDIIIAALQSNSIIKITDIAGNIVYETVSTGGQAIWDGLNMWGEKVKSGVYLIFASSHDGNRSEVIKLAIIR
ncbi:two-component regulator propeller domain-containing protein [Marinilabiliaceae bacterium ANBcel2]|nr:two-component regulator propeller domain-containing protein [Marinilabiliaceae bacterium ANBcel2]